MKPLGEAATKALLNSRHLLLSLTPTASHVIQGSNKVSQAQFALAKYMLTVSVVLFFMCLEMRMYLVTAPGHEVKLVSL